MSEHFGPLGNTVFNRTYSRTKEDGTSETWDDVVARVVEGNSELGPLPATNLERIELSATLKAMILQPGGRHLWATGAGTSLGLFNCFRAGWGDTTSDHFTFVFDQLMLGGGVGANYSSEYLANVNVFSSVTFISYLDKRHPDFVDGLRPSAWYDNDVDVFVVPDSREGWVEALRILLEAHAQPSLAGHVVRMDFSEVRPKGSAIRGFGGTASGPIPLIRMLQSVSELLNGVVRERGDVWHGSVLEPVQLTPLEAMEIDHEIASCVVAGNVRRSARMSMVHWADDSAVAFIQSKDDPSAHWSTNISIEIDNEFIRYVNAPRNPFDARSVRAHLVYDLATERMYEHGEPGFYNSSLASEGERCDVRSTNPCGEIALEEWEACCLGHINLGKFGPDDDKALMEAARLMARFLYRATFAPVSDPRIAEVEARNHRIGVGILGLQEWAAAHGVRYDRIADSTVLMAKLSLLQRVVTTAANEYADQMRHPRPIKTTTVAPTGTISQLSGNTPGIQPIFAKHFIRRVRFADTDPAVVGGSLPENALGIEDDIYSQNTKVVSFLAKDLLTERFPDLVQDQGDLTLGAMLDVQAAIQWAWANNAVSFTAGFDPDKTTLQELRESLRTRLHTLKGTTVFPDMARPQSPIERISSAEYDLERFLLDQGVDENCATGACPIK